jgi:hypothetical protein
MCLIINIRGLEVVWRGTFKMNYPQICGVKFLLDPFTRVIVVGTNSKWWVSSYSRGERSASPILSDYAL